MKFKVALYSSEEGYSVNATGLPGCWSQGTTKAEALANIAAAIREYLDAEIETDDGAEIREVEVNAYTMGGIARSAARSNRSTR